MIEGGSALKKGVDCMSNSPRVFVCLTPAMFSVSRRTTQETVFDGSTLAVVQEIERAVCVQISLSPWFERNFYTKYTAITPGDSISG